MTTKTITIMEDAYHLLRAAKSARESFSDVIRRKLKAKGNIMELAGAWSHISDEEAEEMKRKIRELNEDSTKTLIRRFGQRR